jgi:ribonuclease D
MTFKKVISKEAMARMPREFYKGKIVVVDTEYALKDAIDDLHNHSIIGFDTETRPSFSKRRHYKMALIQLATDEICYLIRLCVFKSMPLILEQFLRDRTVTKIGLSLKDDFHGLNGISHVLPHNFIDLQQYVPQFGIEEMSLQKIYAILFGKKISKRDRLSNWESYELTDAQKRYAALDAWACLRIYHYLSQLQ